MTTENLVTTDEIFNLRLNTEKAHRRTAKRFEGPELVHLTLFALEALGNTFLHKRDRTNTNVWSINISLKCKVIFIYNNLNQQNLSFY